MSLSETERKNIQSREEKEEATAENINDNEVLDGYGEYLSAHIAASVWTRWKTSLLAHAADIFLTADTCKFVAVTAKQLEQEATEEEFDVEVYIEHLRRDTEPHAEDVRSTANNIRIAQCVPKASLVRFKGDLTEDQKRLIEVNRQTAIHRLALRKELKFTEAQRQRIEHNRQVAISRRKFFAEKQRRLSDSEAAIFLKQHQPLSGPPILADGGEYKGGGFSTGDEPP